MQVTVYVDLETFHQQVLNNLEFDAALTQGEHEPVALSVPLQSVYTSEEDEMVLIKHYQERS